MFTSHILMVAMFSVRLLGVSATSVAGAEPELHPYSEVEIAMKRDEGGYAKRGEQSPTTQGSQEPVEGIGTTHLRSNPVSPWVYKSLEDIPKFDKPWSLSDFAKVIPTVYVAAATNYALFLGSTSRSPGSVAEALQVLAVVFFPMLPVMQLLNNLYIMIFRRASWSCCQWRFLLAAVCSQYVAVDTRDEVAVQWVDQQRLNEVRSEDMDEVRQDWRSLRWLGSVVAALSVSAFSSLSTAEYMLRLSRRFENGTTPAALGINHRLGWVAIGSVIAGMMTLCVQLCNSTWERRRLGHAGVARSSNSLMGEYDIFVEIFAAAVVQYCLLIQSLCGIISAPLFLTVVLGIGPFITQSYKLMGNRYRSGRIFRLTLPVVLFLACICMAALHLFVDIVEWLEVSQAIVHPSNYLWMWPDPSWPTL